LTFSEYGRGPHLASIAEVSSVRKLWRIGAWSRQKAPGYNRNNGKYDECSPPIR
jgi:hypothetical protein